MSWQSAVICGVVLNRAGSGAVQVFSKTTIYSGFGKTKTGAFKLSPYILKTFGNQFTSAVGRQFIWFC